MSGRPPGRIAQRAGFALLALIALGASPASSPPSWEISLAHKGEPGVPFVIEGRVLGSGNRPLRDVLIHVYHADDRGDYYRPGAKRPKLSGMARTNVLGGYRIHSVLPGLAEGIPHIHFELAAPGADYRAVTLNLCRATGAGSDTSFAHLQQMLTLPVSTMHWAYVKPDTGRGYRCTWDIPFASLERLEKPPEIFAPPVH